jgi:flagellar motility protein MotE (MotC chaperone)
MVLQSLGERRTELDEREQILEARERQLAVAEERIDQKIAELGALQARIEELLAAYDSQEDEQLMSLVKIYQTMKPKDAAAIFATLEMEILLEIISRMSSIRSAPILAQMDPLRAQEVTEELARRMQQRPDFMAEPVGQ